MIPPRLSGCVAALLALTAACSSVDVLGSRSSKLDEEGIPPANEPQPPRNVFGERDLIPLTQVNARVNNAFLQLFFGDPDTEAVFRDVGDGTGYIEDISNNDVRTDSIGYGMLVTVELDQRDVFDKLWSWAKAHMLSTEGGSTGLLKWRCDTSGENCDPYAATDASSIIATSLLIASGRWGNEGSNNYRNDGLALLRAMISVDTQVGADAEGLVNLFDLEAGLPRLGSGGPLGECPTDYLMPAFYEIWATHDVERAALWGKLATTSRALLAKIPHETTGLLPTNVTYEGAPVAGQEDYGQTTHRALLNLALDHAWNGPHASTQAQNRRLLDFLFEEGVDEYVSDYSLEGERLTAYNTSAHRALIALTAGTVEDRKYDVFLEALLAEPIPTGTYRYYDGMLYMLSMMALSGQLSPG